MTIRRWLVGAATATLAAALPFPLLVLVGSHLVGYGSDPAETWGFPL